MAALLRDDEDTHPVTLRVKAEGMKKFSQALKEPKAPPKKLIEMMRNKRESRKPA